MAPEILALSRANQMRYRHQDMKDLHCMSYTSKGTSEIVVAGIQNQMFIIDVEKGTISKQV